MKLRYKIALFIAGILGCTALFQYFNREVKTDGPAKVSYQNRGNTVVIKEKGKKAKKIYQPDPKSTVIKTDKDGRVSVKVRQFGVGFDPGIGVGFSDRPRIALDTRYAYFKRFGANAGLGFSLDRNDYHYGNLLGIVAPYAGISYVPFVNYANTSVVASYMPFNACAFVFVRVRF